VGEKVCELINNYVLLVRPAFLNGKDEGYLILNRWGGQITVRGVWSIVKRAASLSKITKNVSPHSFRHACATHMLRNGAPIRHLQELLGHASIETTSRYTRITINDLKEVHAKFHPGGSE